MHVTRKLAVRLGHGLGGLLLILAVGYVAFTAGDRHWPYLVQSVDVHPEPARAGGSVAITTVRTYLEDCQLEFDRQMESLDGQGQIRMAPVALPVERERTPWQHSGKPHTIKIAVPSDFPCGSGQVRTKPFASCNWLQYGPLRQRGDDRLTPFEVACESRPG